MFLTMLLVDFFHEDWSARCCDVRSQDDPFMVFTGEYRPLPVGATGLEIGAEVIEGDGWTIRRDGPCAPVDKWRERSDERVSFEIRYSGVTPPMGGIGAFNLVLPTGWRFEIIRVNNPNYSESQYMVARDSESDLEAVMLYFVGVNSRFDLVIEAARGSSAHDRHELCVPVVSRHIVEPSPGNTGTRDLPASTDALDSNVPGQAPRSARDVSSSGNEFGMAVSAFVAADIDLDILVDGELTLQLDHSRGFDYVAATIVVRPDSVITFRAPGLSINRRASQIIDGVEKKLEVRVGSDTRANIPITKEQRRAAMGTPDDVPGLIAVLTQDARYSARVWAATRLGAIGDRRAVAPLMSVVESVRPVQDQYSEWVQSQAALALAELGDPAGVPAIQRALDQLPNRDHYAYLFEAALRDLSAVG
jgi:hypothetical protein